MGLIQTAFEGNLKQVKLLLKAGADVNVKGRHDRTPLMWSVWANDIDIVKELLEAEADVNAIDEWGCTALYDAARLGKTKMVRELILWV